MEGNSLEVNTGVDGQAAAQSEAPATVATPAVATPAEKPPSALGKLMARFGLSKGPKPSAIEIKPPVAPESEGRAVIDRGQLRDKLQEPSQS